MIKYRVGFFILVSRLLVLVQGPVVERDYFNI